MIIVAGHLRVVPAARHAYLASCIEVTRAARGAADYIDFHLSADSLELARIDIFERWKSTKAVEALRESGPDDGQQPVTVEATVVRYEVTNRASLPG